MSDNRKIRRRQRCPECGSLDIIKWGVRNGKQRLKCRNCKSLFSARRKDISKSNRFPWFRKWVSGRMTIEEISASSGYSSRQSDKKHRYQPQIINKYVRVIDRYYDEFTRHVVFNEDKLIELREIKRR